MAPSNKVGWLAYAALLAFIHPVTSSAVAQLAVTQEPVKGTIRLSGAGNGRHLLEIDDAAGFHTPVYSEEFKGPSVVLQSQESGLIPGVHYMLRIDHGPTIDLPLKSSLEIDQPGLDCSLLKNTWNETGRFLTGQAYSQLKWDEQAHRWNPILPAVPIGESIFSAELVLRPALSAARACHDLETMDEIALYYTAMLEKTQTIGSLLKIPNLIDESRNRMIESDPEARTIVARFGSQMIGEGELFNSQWLHPAALLIRLISELPAEEKTPGMQDFVSRFTPFLVRDQLLRVLFDQPMPPLGGRPHRGRVAHWELAMQGLQGQLHWDTAMSDIDLWFLTSAAEILGAHANDPNDVVISSQEIERLKRAIETGVRFFQSKRTLLAGVHDFKGQVVPAASYFNGDYDGESELRGTAVTGEQYPADPVAPARKGASWDIGHMYRVAIFLRGLYENRKATGLQFPAYEDLQLVVNQYLYGVFNGDFRRPLFHNNFDGSDGWYRVGYNGPGFGQPPSAYCDMHNVKRLCMTPGSIVGWPELSFVNPDLGRLEQTMIRIAFDHSTETRAFADRYYFWSAPFGVTVSGGRKICGGAFYAIAAENADRLIAAGTSH